MSMFRSRKGKLYYLTLIKEWDEASRRCRTHPQDARWENRDDGELPIHLACRFREAPLGLIRQLHEAYNEGVKTTSNTGYLPLHCACWSSASLEVITYLVEAYGEGVKTRSSSGRLPLHYACRESASPEVIRYLVEVYGEGVKMTGNGGWLPLHYACRWSASLEVITYLHGFYPDGVTEKDNNEHTPVDNLRYNNNLSKEDKAKARDILSSPPTNPMLHTACKNGSSLGVIRNLHELDREEIKTAIRGGSLPIHIACENGASLEVVKYLHDAYWEGSKTADSCGNLPIHLACENGASLEVVKYLHDAYWEGSKTANDDGNLPIHIACEQSSPLEIIRYLHEAYWEGAKSGNGDGNLPVYIACEKGAPLEIIRYLHEASGEGRETKNKRGSLAIYIACEKVASLDTVRYLCEAYREDCKTANDDGSLLIHIACEKVSSLEVIQCLHEAYREGSKSANGDGNLPLHIACENGASLEVVKYLHGAYCEGSKTANRDGNLPLHIACEKGASLELIQYLLETHREGSTTRNSRGCLPIHIVCEKDASPGVIAFLQEAFEDGIKEEGPKGKLPIHLACQCTSSLDVVRYLHSHYPAGATKGCSIVDLLQNNTKLASEDKEAARSFLLTSPPRPLTHMIKHTPSGTTAEVSADLSITPKIMTPSICTPSSPTTSTRPSTSTTPGNDSSGDDQCTKANAVAVVARNTATTASGQPSETLSSPSSPVWPSMSPPDEGSVANVETNGHASDISPAGDIAAAPGTTTSAHVSNTTTTLSTTATTASSMTGGSLHRHDTPSSPTTGGSRRRHDAPSSPTTSTWSITSSGVAVVERKEGSGGERESDIRKDGSCMLLTQAGGDVLSPPGDVGRREPERAPMDLRQRRPNRSPADTSQGGVRRRPERGDVDEYREATDAADAAVDAHKSARGDAARLAAKAAAAGDEVEEAKAAAEELDAAEAEAASAKVEAYAAVRAAQAALEEASKRHAAAKEAAEMGRGRADAAERNADQLREEAEAARANVQRTFVAANKALARKQEVRYRMFAPDRDKLKLFFEPGKRRFSPSTELSLEYVKYCTSNEGRVGEGDFGLENRGFSDERKLGEGAFGVVYRGYDDVLRRRFAVKRIKYEIRMATDEAGVRSARKMLETELKVLNEFQHSHIARLYGYILTENLQGEQILVYELASRGSLDTFFESKEKRSELPWQRRVLISLQVASVIRFLHESGGGGEEEEHICYHRDVKSANICLRADYSAMLIDCGLAKMIPKDDSQAHGLSAKTTSGGQPGTIEYMCPLHASGVPVSDRSDVFAFGIVLLELLTGSVQRRRPHGFYDRYVSKIAGGPGNQSLLDGDVDKVAGRWKIDARQQYSSLALECIQTDPNERPPMREVFSRLGDVAQRHCFLLPEEVEQILCGKKARSHECVLDIVEELRAKHEEMISKQDETMANQVEAMAKQEETNAKLRSIGQGVWGANVKIDSILRQLQWMTAALTSVVRGEQCPCPRLAILVPSGSCDKITLQSPSGWLSKDVHLYFLCACDLTPVQHPVVLRVTREWLDKAMPFLKIGMFVLRAASAAGRASTGLPFELLPGLAGEALQLLDSGYQSIVGSAWHEDLESYCESLVVAGESSCSEAAVARGKALTDEAYEVVAANACKENNKSWAREMELVESGHDGLLWIKRENKPRWMQLLGNS